LQGSPEASVLAASTFQNSGAAIVVDDRGRISMLWSEIENAADYWLALECSP
jgi:hypothetical protein